jgi:hypothetical protein
MLTDRALVRNFCAFKYITTVSAFPLYRCVFLEDLALLNVGEQFQISFFMVRFDFGDCTKNADRFFEAFFFRDVSKSRVECSPFEFFAFCRCFQVLCG